jgi:hypothetical protein
MGGQRKFGGIGNRRCGAVGRQPDDFAEADTMHDAVVFGGGAESR